MKALLKISGEKDNKTNKLKEYIQQHPIVGYVGGLGLIGGGMYGGYKFGKAVLKLTGNSKKAASKEVKSASKPATNKTKTEKADKTNVSGKVKFSDGREVEFGDMERFDKAMKENNSMVL